MTIQGARRASQPPRRLNMAALLLFVPLPLQPTERMTAQLAAGQLLHPLHGLNQRQRLYAGAITHGIQHQHQVLGRQVASRSGREGAAAQTTDGTDRKSTRLNSSHVKISYAVLCVKKKM